MKRKINLFILCFCLIFNSVLVSADKSISAEFKLAYQIIENYNKEQFEKEIEFDNNIKLRKVLYYVMSVVPEKIKFNIKTVTKGENVTNYLTLEISDVRYKDARAMGTMISNSILKPEMPFKDKVKISHDYIVKNCEYDENANSNNQDMSAYSISGVFLDEIAVCDGYTGAMMFLLNSVDIQCFRLVSNTMNHSFNVIFNGDFFYFLDATHDDPTPDVKNNVSYNFFMLTYDELIKKGHEFDLSTDETVSYQEFMSFFKFYLKQIGYKGPSKNATIEKNNMVNILTMLNIIEKDSMTPAISYLRLFEINNPQMEFQTQKLNVDYYLRKNITNEFAKEFLQNLGFYDLNRNFYWYTMTQPSSYNWSSNDVVENLFHGLFSQISKEEMNYADFLLKETKDEKVVVKFLISNFWVDI